AMAVLACWFLWPKAVDPVWREKYDRIQIGMTQAEVETIMDHRPMKAEIDLVGFAWKTVAFEPQMAPLTTDANALWGDYDTNIRVSYLQGKVVSKVLTAHMPAWEYTVLWCRRKLGF